MEMLFACMWSITDSKCGDTLYLLPVLSCQSLIPVIFARVFYIQALSTVIFTHLYRIFCIQANHANGMVCVMEIQIYEYLNFFDAQ